MSDFYTVLKQKIVERDLRSAAEREEVYAQARAAMVRRLWSYDPPLADDEIDSRIGAFDKAVERIESDMVRALSAGAPSRRLGFDPRPEQAIAAVVEGYDDDADYLPAVARPALPPAPNDDDLDEIWSSGGADLPALSPPSPAARDDRGREREEEDAAPARDERGPIVDHDAEQRQWEDRAAERLADRWRPLPQADDEYDDESEEEEEREREPAPPRPPRPGLRERLSGLTAPLLLRWRGTSEGARVRILLGAIGLLAVILIGIGLYALLPLFLGSSGGDAPDAIAGGDTVEKVVRVSDPATAARIPTEPQDVLQSYVLFDGRDPTVFESSPGNPVHFDGDTSGGFARVSSSASDAGARAIIGPGLAAKLAGKTLRIVITARSSKEAGAANFRFAYQSGVAVSFWQTADLKPGYTPLGLIWRAPAVRTDPSGDHLLIEPGIPGDGTALDIQSIRIDVLAS